MRQTLILLLILIASSVQTQSNFQYSLGLDANYSGIEIFQDGDQVNLAIGPTEYILSVGIGLDAEYKFQKSGILGSLRYKRLGANSVLESIIIEATVYDVRLDLFSLEFGYKYFPTSSGAFVKLGVGLNYIFNVSNEGKEEFDVLILDPKDRRVPAISLGIGYEISNGHSLSFTWNESLTDFYGFTARGANGSTRDVGLKYRSLDLSYSISFNELKKFWSHE